MYDVPSVYRSTVVRGCLRRLCFDEICIVHRGGHRTLGRYKSNNDII